MSIANTTAATALVGHSEPECGTAQSWAWTLAVVALLGLAILGLLGGEFGTGVQVAADTDRIGSSAARGGLDAVLAGIRWVR